MRDGFVKVAAVSPDLRPADPAFNAEGIIVLSKKAYGDGAVIILFPELSIHGWRIPTGVTRQIWRKSLSG